jgi:succinate dehydrogenase/fumarate reductase cytochrome b subunit
VSDTVKRGAAKAENSAPLRVAARAGYAVNGIVHILIGLIAISVALGAGGEADQSGALAQLAQAPAGMLLLWVIAIALFALGSWQALHAIVSSMPDAKRRWLHRLSGLAKSLVYFFVGATAVTFARGSSTSAEGSSKTLSSQLIAMPGGAVILIAIGVIVIAIGVGFIVRGISRRFLERIVPPGGSLGRLVTVLGVAGYTLEGVALSVVGMLFWAAAATLDPNKAGGLDGALKALVSLPYGVIIVTVVGIGFIAFGLYNEFRSRFARL